MNQVLETYPTTQRDRGTSCPSRFDLALGLLATLLSACLGCRSQPAAYFARSLPAQYAARPVTNPEVFDLSQLAQAQARSELLGPGDLVEVIVSTGLERDEGNRWNVRVSEQGDAQLPLIGAVRVAGLPLPEAERRIREAGIQRGQFVNPNVSVQLKERHTIRVAVVGAVADPGIQELPASSSDLFNALLAAGGLTPDADTMVEIRRPGLGRLAPGRELSGNPQESPTRYATFPAAGPPPVSGAMDSFDRELQRPIQQVDLREVSAGHTGDFRVEDGTTVVVSKRAREYIHVMGLVKRSDQFEMKPGQELRLLDALALAQGRTLEIADKVRVIRRTADNRRPVIIEASVARAKSDGAENLLLAPGDVVSVEETPATLVVGTIRDFVRVGFTSAIPGF